MNKYTKSVGIKIISVIAMAVLLLAASASRNELLTEVINSPVADDFTLMNTQGQNVSLSDYRGKFVLLNFWATWCPPCVKEMPALSDLHNTLKLPDGGLHVVAIHVGPALATVNQFLQDRPVSFDVLIDSDMSLAAWEVAGLPTTFLISPSGKIIHKAVGEREWNAPAMQDLLKKIMQQHEQLTALQAATKDS